MDLSGTSKLGGRIFFISRKWAPAVGGMETYAMRLNQELANRTSVDVVALPGRANGMPPHILSLLSFPFPVLGRLLARRHGIAVLHVADMAIWPLALLAWLVRPAPRVVLSAHGTDVSYHRRPTLRGRLYGAYLKLGSRLLARATVIANSRATAEVLRETGWNRATVVPLATDMEGAPANGCHNGEILFVGRLVERKGCGWFIRNVLPLLPPETRLKVAGTIWDKSERAALGDSRVEFLGSLSGQALIEAYRSSMCVIVPNIELASGEYECFGLVAVEAAAAGGLVIAADCGGLTDAVRDGETGYLAPSGDAEAWRDMIAQVARWGREERQRLLEKSMKIARDYYCWERVTVETIKAYAITQPD